MAQRTKMLVTAAICLVCQVALLGLLFPPDSLAQDCGGGPPCLPGQHCSGGVCVCDGTSCTTGCCNGSICSSSTFSHCGIGGNQCVVCDADTANSCVTGVCRCGAEPACSEEICSEEGQCVAPPPGPVASPSGRVAIVFVVGAALAYQLWRHRRRSSDV